jgi:phytoene desaturase
MRSRKVSNLFFAGQLTVPGPGLPPAFLSGKIAAQEAIRNFRTQHSLEPNITTVHA